MECLILRGDVSLKLKQIVAYADDVALLARSPKTFKEIFHKLQNEATLVGLNINEDKTKYMQIKRTGTKDMTHLKFDNFAFEHVENFNCLGSILNADNKMNIEIAERIAKGNKAYYDNAKLIKSKFVKRNTKMKIYKMMIRPIVTCSSETWTLAAEDENNLCIFERQILRKVFGPLNIDNIWRIRNNVEIDKLIEGANIVRFIKAQRIKWLGHIQRMDQARPTRKLLNWKPIGTRPVGRPRQRWQEDVMEDLKKLKVKNWKAIAKDRRTWRDLAEKAKTHKGL
jgi:hypothetical protein